MSSLRVVFAGKLKFKPGEVERTAHIPLANDPTGEVRHFFVTLDNVKGRDKLGDVIKCKVKISSEASELIAPLLDLLIRFTSRSLFLVPPNVVENFNADLCGPQAIRLSWLPPQEGAPVDGYRVTYWSRPGTVKTMDLPCDVRKYMLT